MTDNGLDLFGGHAIDDIPESNDLPVGVYPETVIDSAKVFKSNAGPHGIGTNFKDISDDGFGLSAFQWLGIPAPANRAQYLLRDLKALGLSGEQIVRIAGFVEGSDPETAIVDIAGINEVLSEIKGNSGTTSITEYKKKNGEKGQNVAFKLDDEDVPSPVAANKDWDAPAPTEDNPAEADTAAWFG